MKKKGLTPIVTISAVTIFLLAAFAGIYLYRSGSEIKMNKTFSNLSVGEQKELEVLSQKLISASSADNPKNIQPMDPQLLKKLEDYITNSSSDNICDMRASDLEVILDYAQMSAELGRSDIYQKMMAMARDVASVIVGRDTVYLYKPAKESGITQEAHDRDYYIQLAMMFELEKEVIDSLINDTDLSSGKLNVCRKGCCDKLPGIVRLLDCRKSDGLWQGEAYRAYLTTVGNKSFAESSGQWDMTIDLSSCGSNPVQTTWEGSWIWDWKASFSTGSEGKDSAKGDLSFATDSTGTASFMIGSMPAFAQITQSVMTINFSMPNLGEISLKGDIVRSN